MVWNVTLKGIARRNRHIMMNVQQKVAVIGGGNWGKILVRNFHELGRLAIICDNNTDREFSSYCLCTWFSLRPFDS